MSTVSETIIAESTQQQVRPKTREQLHDPTTRALLLTGHPLITNEALLLTPPVEELYRKVKRVVILRETGCAFSAPSGAGKSSALWMLTNMLKLELPNLYIFTHQTHTGGVKTERSIFKHLLSSIKHGSTAGQTEDLRIRLVNTMADQAKHSGLNMVVMLIDEAQALSNEEFQLLKDISNDLQKERVQLVTIFMGQSPDLEARIRDIWLSAKLDLVGRFAMRHHTFRAYNSLSDLAALLKGIDEEIYPYDSDWSWTEFFLPKAFGAGFRLASEAPHFFDALKAASPHVSSGEFRFPARQVFTAIRTFLVDSADLDSHDLRLPPTRWQEAIDYALLGEAMQMMEKPRDQSEVRT
ncbi:MAG: ATP-binding protein [Burkholderiales bacterium]|nr:ATP-binding protein [Burkholderiales bacterium]